MPNFEKMCIAGTGPRFVYSKIDVVVRTATRAEIEWVRKNVGVVRLHLTRALRASTRYGVLILCGRRIEFMVVHGRAARVRWSRSLIRERSLFFENIFQQTSWTGTHQRWHE